MLGKMRLITHWFPSIFDDYVDFSPTSIICDHNETLYADAKALYKKCEQLGVDVEMIEMKGTFHAFAPIVTGSPETKQILEKILHLANIYSVTFQYMGE